MPDVCAAHLDADERRHRFNVLGVGVSAIDMPATLRMIGAWIASGDRQYVCITGVNGIMVAQKDQGLRETYNAAGMVTPDGMPLVWIGRLIGRAIDRVYGPDVLLAACEQSIAMGWRHYFYGGSAGVPELLARKLQERYPGLHVVGTYSPPFRALTPDEEAEVLGRINDAGADIVWVGIGTPKQERWMGAMRSRLHAPVLVGIGAGFDFHAGLKRQAPRWMQRAGLEWFFRLLQEPTRLWHRYLVYNPLFLWGILLQALSLRRHELDYPAGFSTNVDGARGGDR